MIKTIEDLEENTKISITTIINKATFSFFNGRRLVTR